MFKKIFLIIFLSFVNTVLFAEQIIIFEIEKAHNFKLIEHTFKVSETDFFDKSHEYFYALVPFNESLEKSINIALNKYGIKISAVSLLENNIRLNEDIILKKYLIIEKKYDIVKENGKKFYKFKIYKNKFNISSSKSKNFFQSLIEQFKIEYGIN